MAQMTALRRRMIDDMTVRNLSPATQQSYVYAVAKFSRFFGCSPDRLGVGEVRDPYALHRASSFGHLGLSPLLRVYNPSGSPPPSLPGMRSSHTSRHHE
jgi:hypothetical protein